MLHSARPESNPGNASPNQALHSLSAPNSLPFSAIARFVLGPVLGRSGLRASSDFGQFICLDAPQGELGEAEVRGGETASTTPSGQRRALASELPRHPGQPVRARPQS